MKWRQVVPSLITLLAMLAGFLSMVVTVEGMHTGDTDLYRWAAKLIMLSMILDGLDGNVARWIKGQSAFGAELDTYVDLTAFGIAPAILIYAVTLANKDMFWRVLLPSAVALSGVVRLARFKVKDPLRGQGGYAGLPITANAGWVAVFVFISTVPPSAGSPNHDPLSLQHGWFASLFLVGVISFILLQVTNFRYPKPTKKWWMFALCVLLVVLFVALSARSAMRVAIAMLILGAGYAILGPLFVKGMQVHHRRKEARRQGSSAGPDGAGAGQ